MRIFFSILFIALAVISCEKEAPRYQDRLATQFAPIQSDACLLGDKILWYEDSTDAEGKMWQVPVWRRDNFNVHDSLHISDLGSLYSNYDIEYWGNIAIIQTRKLYTHARTFTRIISFDENGYQMNDTTIYDKKLGERLEFDECLVLTLDDPYVSTQAYPIPERNGYTCKTVVLSKTLGLVKAVTEPRWGMYTNYYAFRVLENKQLKIQYEVEEGCGGCMDEYWWYYEVTIGPEGKFVDAKITTYPGNRGLNFPSDETFLEKEREIWQ